MGRSLEKGKIRPKAGPHMRAGFVAIQTDIDFWLLLGSGNREFDSTCNIEKCIL